MWAYSHYQKSIRKKEEIRKNNERISYIRKKYPNAYAKYWGKNVDPSPYYCFHGTLGIYRTPNRIANETFSDSEWEELEKRVKSQREAERKKKEDKDWETAQSKFASEMRKVVPQKLQTFGNYTYTYPISTKNGNQLNMKIWQHFAYEVCLEKDLDYTYNQLTLSNNNKLSQWQNNCIHLNNTLRKQIRDIITLLAKEKKVVVFFNEIIEGWDDMALNCSYAPISVGLPKSIKKIIVATKKVMGLESKSGKELLVEESPECVVIIDAFTTNEQLKKNCEFVFNALQDKHPVLAYFSLIKAYDRQEMIDIIKRSEENHKAKVWEKTQSSFAENMYTLVHEKLSEFGNYSYNCPFTTKNDYQLNMKIWQHFAYGVCLEKDLDYSYNQSIFDNTQRLPQLQKFGIFPSKEVLNQLDVLIQQLSANKKTLVLYNEEIEGWDINSLCHTYVSIEADMPQTTISINVAADKALDIETKSGKELLVEESPECIVIIDAFTTNEQLKKNCEFVFNAFQDKHPILAYISLIKAYDRQEMSAYIERSKIEAEEKRKAEIKAKLQSTAKDEFSKKVKVWKKIGINFYCSWLFYYYPVSLPDFKPTLEEEKNRWTVWDFKNAPERNITSDEHEKALNRVIPLIKNMLIDTFGKEYLLLITLVCIPASTKENNAARYEEFSKRLCEETGMENAYNHIRIIKDGLARNHPDNTTGKSIRPSVEYDKDFFKDKFVLLFDDIITNGDTILNYRKKIDDLGAIVIGGMSLGKTKHERPI